MATLFINLSSSRCGACGKDADPREPSHERILGYNPGPGCGALFDSVSSDYTGMDRNIKRMRPDLRFIDPLDALRSKP